MNNTGLKFGGRQKGTPNKITSEIRDKLFMLIEHTIEDLCTSSLSISHKIKLLEISLNYTLPRLKHIHRQNENVKPKTFVVQYVDENKSNTSKK